MIQGISHWAEGIVIAVILITILEMLLPEGKNKKYIKTVFGVYLLFTILSPVIKVVTGEEINMENILEMQEMTNVAQPSTISTNSSVESIYKANLEKDIKAKLEQKGYEASNISIQIETKDEKTYGKIYQISMQLGKKEAESTTVNKVEEVQIQIGKDTEKKEKEVVADKEKQEIRQLLSTTYDVEESNIIIW